VADQTTTVITYYQETHWNWWGFVGTAILVAVVMGAAVYLWRRLFGVRR
jgi:hypothetical protein